MFFRRNSSSRAMLLACASLSLLLAACGDDSESGGSTTTSSTTSTTAGSGGSTSGTGGEGGSTVGSGGQGGVAVGGMGGMAANQLTNSGFEMFSAGANPPFDPPDSWVSFGAELPFMAVGYDSYATQAHDAFIFSPADPNDESNLYPGYMMSRGLKTWGRNLAAGATDLAHTIGIVYQEFAGAIVPSGAKLTLSGWAYVSTVDPLGADNNVYLVIKCFPDDFSAEYCDGGTGMKSDLITNATPTNTWTQFSATVDALDANVTIVQAGVEFEQCATAACNTGGGAVFWDGLHFSWQ